MLQKVLNLPESDEMILSMLENDIAQEFSRVDADPEPTMEELQGRSDALDPMAKLRRGVPAPPDAPESELDQRMNILDGMDHDPEDLQARNDALNPMAHLQNTVPAMPDSDEQALDEKLAILHDKQVDPKELEQRQGQLDSGYDKNQDDELMEMRRQALRPQGITTEDMMVLEDKLAQLEKMDVKWDYKTAANHLEYDDHEDFVIEQARALRRGLPPLDKETQAQLTDPTELPDGLKPRDDMEALESLDHLPQKGDDARARLDALQAGLPNGQAHKDEVEEAEYQMLGQEAGLLPPPLKRQDSIEVVDDQAASKQAASEKRKNDRVYQSLKGATQHGGLDLGLDIMKERKSKKLGRFMKSKSTYTDTLKSRIPGYEVAKQGQKARKEMHRINASESMAKGTESNELLQAILACGLYYQRYKRDKAMIKSATSIPTYGTGPVGSAVKAGIKSVGIPGSFWARYLHAGKGKTQGSYQKQKMTGKRGKKIGDLRDVRNLRALLYSAGSGSHDPRMQRVGGALGSNGEDLSKREPSKDKKMLNGSQDDYLSFAERNVYQGLKDGTMTGDQVPAEMILPILWRMHKIFATVSRYKSEQLTLQDKALAKYEAEKAKAEAKLAQGKKATMPRMSAEARKARRRQNDAARQAQMDNRPMASMADSGPDLSPNKDQSMDALAPQGGFLAHARNLDNMPEQGLPDTDRKTDVENDRVDVIQDKEKKKDKKPMLLA
jgi:hypothetical protein